MFAILEADALHENGGLGMPLLLFLFIQHLPQTPDGLRLSVASIADGLRVYVQIGSVSSLNARTHAAPGGGFHLGGACLA